MRYLPDNNSKTGKQTMTTIPKIRYSRRSMLKASGAADRALAVGATLPPFELSNQRGETVRSSELLARGPLVLTVYRGVW